jgi:serine/threonine protein kinase
MLSSIPAPLVGRIRRSEFGVDRPSSPPTQPPPRPQLVTEGQLLGGAYRVRRPIGSGGLGQVLDAMDETLGRRVALKLSWEPNDRLRAEARAIAAFRHPSLPTLHYFGTDRSLDFVVLERIYGVTVSDQLTILQQAEEPMSTREVIELLSATADAISTIHEAGLFHLDVRPSNIMLTADRRVVLMDFGLVVPELGLAAQARHAGTRNYMAPELVGPVDVETARLADIYGLGVTAFELLTGRVPVEVRSVAELARRQDPLPSVRSFRSDVPEELAYLVDAMLDLDPARRPATADTVRRQLTPSRRPVQQTRSYRLMVVEDSPFIAKTLAKYANNALPDVDVQVHYSAESALEALKTWEPDAMLLDMHMDGMNGIELCMYMRGAGIAPSCELIAVSASISADDRELLHLLGIRHFLAKDAQLQARLKPLLVEVRGRQVS